LLDREKLLKLLRLTTSDHVHEVAGAMRAANRLIEAEKMTWEDVLAGPEKSFRISIHREQPQATPNGFYEGEEAWTPPHLKDKVIIDTMFRAVYAQPRTGNDSFWDWLDDIHGKFEQHGSLTNGQYQALARCYRRAVRAGT
jgi:hypothetical protein